MQSESLHKCPAKGQRSIEFFQIFFKIPPGIANIFDHCVILWGSMNPHSSMPPSLALPFSCTQIPQHNACQSAPKKQRSGLFIDWPFKSQHMLLCFYSTVFSEMEHFLILPQGLLLRSGVTRTRCKWEEKVGRNVNWSDTSVNVRVSTCVRVCLCEHLGLFCRDAQRQHI